MAVALAAPWLSLPEIAGANIYWTPPYGALTTPAIVYRPDNPWIERQESYRAWIENYVAICLVAPSSGPDGIAQIYDLALLIKAAVDGDPALAGWKWKNVGGIVETEQAGFKYLAAAVRLSFSAEY